jgi:uncharacterized membrane protein YcaP (DUF421 family)
MDGIWQDLFVSGVPIAEKVVRTILVYVALVIGLRIFGKRELGQLNPLDMIILLLLANTVQNAIIGSDNSLIGGLVGAAVLLIINATIVRVAYKHPALRRAIEGHSDVILRDGQVVTRALEANALTREELLAAAREQGIASLSEVECARLELSGKISFTKHEGVDNTGAFRSEVLKRLAAIEKQLSARST